MTSLTDLTTLKFTESAEVATIHLVSKHTSMRMIKEMGKVFDHLEDQSSCTVLVLKGTDGNFNQGLDFSDFQPNQPMDIHGFHKWEDLYPSRTFAIGHHCHLRRTSCWWRSTNGFVL